MNRRGLKKCDICRLNLNDGVTLEFTIKFPSKWNEAMNLAQFRDARMHTQCARKYIALPDGEMRSMLMKLHIRLRHFNRWDD